VRVVRQSCPGAAGDVAVPDDIVIVETSGLVPPPRPLQTAARPRIPAPVFAVSWPGCGDV